MRNLNEQPLRPIGTTFEEITETTHERIITTLRVVSHQHGADDRIYEIVQEIDEVRQPKTALGGKEKKR